MPAQDSPDTSDTSPPPLPALLCRSHPRVRGKETHHANTLVLSLHDLHGCLADFHAQPGFRNFLKIFKQQAIQRFRPVERKIQSQRPVQVAQGACQESSSLPGTLVVNFPMISSMMSSSVISPMISPYSSTTRAMRCRFSRKNCSCV